MNFKGKSEAGTYFPASILYAFLSPYSAASPVVLSTPDSPLKPAYIVPATVS